MIASITRLKSHVVFAGLALTLLVSASTPMLGGQDAFAKNHKPRGHHGQVQRDNAKDQENSNQQQDPQVKLGLKRPYDVAIEDIAIEPHADAGHRTVIVTVHNASNRPVAGFTIGMQAKRADGTLRTEVFSSPLTIAWGQSTEVEFRLGCNWINNGTITARTNPTPLVGEHNATNNTLVESFGGGCV